MKGVRLFLLAMIIVLLMACAEREPSEQLPNVDLVAGEVTKEPSGQLKEPPNVHLVADETTYMMQRGGYEWTIKRTFGREETTIADAVAPNESLKRGLITLAKDAQMELQFEVQPDRYRVFGWYEEGPSKLFSHLQYIVGEQSVAIEIVAYYPQGHVSYVLPVKFE
ncbi:hypothetical protein AAGS61_18285 [Lysinibacillus sp. KU-BSD001]|uniref:hypothetical protein n=1 Tax=Lysinibacillus sp. KU-BSD001 TaxID=3141328 RepID=UPI0036F09859